MQEACISSEGKKSDCSWKITSGCILKKRCTLHETGVAAAAAAAAAAVAAAAAAALFMARYKGAGGRNVSSLNLLPGFFQYRQGKWCKQGADSPCKWGERKKLYDAWVL